MAIRFPDIKVGLHLSPDAERLFSKRDWQRGLRASLVFAGRDFIALALPKRFTPFAISRLNYDAKKLHQNKSREQLIRIALGQMRVNGDRAKIVALACAPWGGWDPTGKGGAPDVIWRQWYQNAVRTGRVRPAKDAEGWRQARQEMRRDVLVQSRLRERLRNWAIDEYVDQDKTEPVPLVDTGWLEKNALSNARPDAKTKGGEAELRIIIPRGNRVAPVVGRTLSQKTTEEAERVAAITGAQMASFIQNARIVGTPRKPRLRSTARQRRRIDSLIRGSMTASARARAKTNRPTTHQSSRN